MRQFRSTWSVPGTISKDFPYLDGHFPNQPIVPGVVILDKSVDVIRENLNSSTAQTVHPIQLREIKSAKFLAPLLPGELVEIVASAITTEGADASGVFHWNVDWSRVDDGAKIAKLVLGVK